MPEEYAPPVVAVVVTRDPGSCLEDCLESLGAQDYENLEVLVVDDGSDRDPTARIAAVLPRAVVRRRPTPSGFAASANEALAGIDGAAFFLFCHDDLSLAPDGVRRLVGEAFRSNAGVVGPKLVDWHHPDRLLHVGLAVDRLGASDARVEGGELDQSQHDEAREVFAVPAGCELVRVDLFAALGGMDEEMDVLAEDVDLCWRAQVAGARIVVAPQAVARHLEHSSVGDRRTGDPTDRRDELRAVLKNYGALRRLVALSLLLLSGAAGRVLPPARSGSARPSAGSGRWRWNLARRSSLHEARRALNELRSAPDAEVVARMRRRPQRHGLPPRSHELHVAARWRAELSEVARHEAGRLVKRGSQEIDYRGGSGVIATAVLAIAVVLSVRGILVGHLPVVGQLLPLPTGSDLFAHYFTGRGDPGWGPTQVSPSAYAVMGLLAMLTGNSSAVALKALLLAGPIVGTIGVARLVSDFGSARARLAAALAFVASPVVWNALAAGNVGASVALASMPFVVRRIARATGLRPFAPAHTEPVGTNGLRRVVADVVPLGILLALAASVAPPVLLDTGVVAVAILLATVVTGELGGALRSLGVTALACIVACLCAMPSSITWLQQGRWSLFAGAVGSPGSSPGPAALLRGAAGPVGASFLAFGLVAAASFALVAAREARLAWAARWFTAVLLDVALAWAGGRGWLGSGGGDTSALLAPMAVGVAACCGLGIVAFERDLARYRFGWRQGLALCAATCLVGGLLPGAGVAVGGRAGLAGSGFEGVLSWMPGAASGTGSASASRTLWLGDPRSLPGRPWEISPGLAALSSAEGLPGADAEWPAPDEVQAVRLSQEIRAAEAGRTLQLGSILAPLGIRYVIVPDAGAPVIAGEQSPPVHAAPAPLLPALEGQTDLRELPPEAGVVVFENVAWHRADGTGLIAPARRTSSPALRDAGLAAGLLVVIACLAEGVLRRRRPHLEARDEASAGGLPPGAEDPGGLGGEGLVAAGAAGFPENDATPADAPVLQGAE